MAINVADNFSYKGPKPLDSRTSYTTVAAMASANTAELYDGIVAFCAEDESYYSYKSSNTVDETTGKWRSFQDGYDVIEQAVIAKGQTPASSSPADIAAAINKLDCMAFATSSEVFKGLYDADTELEMNAPTITTDFEYYEEDPVI